MSRWKLADDLAAIVAARTIEWEKLRNGHLLLTGGTGFIGRWLLEALQEANDQLRLKLKISVPSRQPENFRQRASHLFANGMLTVFPLDLSIHPPSGEFTHIIHAATDASATLNEREPLTVFRTIVRGTEHVLELAASQNGVRTLFLSSGAIYGQQPPELMGIPENWRGSPDLQVARNTYGEAKRAAEMLCTIYRKQFGIDVVSARIFSLLGPFLPLELHFAAGNFIRDALEKKPVIVRSNGRPVRSYLYPGDLVTWLLTLLTKSSRETAYNIGSERAVSIGGLAEIVSSLIGQVGYEIQGHDDHGWNAGRYVPDTSLIRNEFGLKETVSLETAILNTASAPQAVNRPGF
ncbi:NAD-dependent epimerase/dehydratase family protein [Azonexus fungiphilus]|uniref:NAD-dependent epimerase/dehydratase family protein n=1 Tax=Azonexus fungiphilus TaxID=146940 RepID=UPI00156AB2C8|nr:NAD(P)-dependent oxidoreductase [Azonexus fungiphilus]NHC07258.1 NAD(P)-dependent oxidoreductase [Azonexus fungiphilus]